MAGRGPAPGANPNRKAAIHRRRRNIEPGFDDLPREGYQGEFPPLPSGYNAEVPTPKGWKTRRRPYLARTREWYLTWARSPMAVRFTQVDWMRLQDLAPLKDRYYRLPSKELAGELRLQETLLGATVMDRQRMRLRISDAPEEEEKPLAQVRRLRAVDPSAG